MKFIKEIFNKQQLEYLTKKRPDLIPMDEPSLEDHLLSNPTIDEAIVEFLKKYDVNVKPRSVGKWNGWDTLSTVGLLIGGSNRNIASSIITSGKSNQTNSAAQDWGTWKRWVIDTKTKEFEKFKKELNLSVEIQNKKIRKESEELIKKARLNNEKILDHLAENDVKKYIDNEIKKSKELRDKLKLIFPGVCMLDIIFFGATLTTLSIIYFVIRFLWKNFFKEFTQNTIKQIEKDLPE